MAFAIPCFIGLLVTVSAGFGADRQRALDLMETYAESVGRGLSVFFMEASSVASAAATLPSVRSLDWNTAGMELANIIHSSHYISRMSIMDSEGYIYDAYAAGPGGNPWQGGRRTMDNTSPDSEPIQGNDYPFFRALVAENTRGERRTMTSPPIVPRGLHEKAIMTSAAIISNGRAVGVVNVEQTAMDLSKLYSWIAADFEEKFGKEAHLYLASSGGLDAQLISVLEYNEYYKTYMDTLFSVNENVYGRDMDESLIAALEAAATSDEPVIVASFDGKEHFVSRQFVSSFTIEGTPFGVFLAVPARALLSPSRRMCIAGGAVLALLLTATVAGAVVIKKIVPDDGGNERSRGRG